MNLKNKFHRARATGDIKWFTFQSAAYRVARTLAETWGGGGGAGYSDISPPVKHVTVEMECLAVSYSITQI